MQSRFQLIFTGVLILAGIAGIIVFATSKRGSSTNAPQVVMWGTVNGALVGNFLAQVGPDHRDTLNVQYIEKNASTFENDLIAALARGQGPDLILLPQDLIVKELDKFYPVPFTNYSERTFRDSFIQEGELYLTPDGIIGFPFTVDPMVMYWNRDIFTDAGFAAPPSTWTDFFNIAPKITKRSPQGDITESAIAFGESKNVTHFKDVISLLSMQAGTPMVKRDDQGAFESAFADRGSSLAPAEEAVSYYTEFSNPTKDSYSWNRALPADKNAFIGGKLAVYFGYASEIQSIRNANPNLNFDVAMVPQTESGKKMTFGAMNAISILKASKNVAAAYTAAVTMTSSSLIDAWSKAADLPPVRRDLITTLPGDAYKAVFWQSALVASAWLDPNRTATQDIFARLVENVTSGSLRVSEAVHEASLEIDNLLRTNQ